MKTLIKHILVVTVAWGLMGISVGYGQDMPGEASEDAPAVAESVAVDAAAGEETEVTKEPEIVNTNGGIQLNFKDATIETILNYLSEVGGLVVVADVSLTDRISVISKQAINIEEAVALINTVLIEKDYAAVKTGRTLKIVPLDEAKMMNIPVRSGNDPDKIVPSDELVTHVIPIRYADATKLRDELADLVPEYANMTSNQETNTLVLTDTTANIKRLVEIIKAMDSQMAGVADIKVYHLKYSDAQNMATMVNELFESNGTNNQQQGGGNPFERFMRRGGRGGPGGDDSSSGSNDRTKVVASSDTYTNSLVVTGPPDILRLIDNLVEDMDSNPLEEQSVMVYKLENAQADNLKEVLNNLFQEMQQVLTQGSGGTGGFGGRGGFGGFGGRTSSTASSNSGDLVGQVYFEADTDTNSILAIAASKHFDKIRNIISELDKPVPQVLIKVLLAEVTHDGSLDVGVEFSQMNIRHNGGTTMEGTDFGVAPNTTGLIMNTIEGNFDVYVRALETEGDLNILSRPYILTSNNNAATITVGEEVPFIRNTRLTETGQTINTIEYEDIGIILEVTPSINYEGLVTMDIRPEISATTGTTVPISETVNAAVFAKRSAESRVAVRDGQTIVIGGLVQDREVETINKVPLLGDIPLIGLLFQRKETEKQKTELLIFITPQVAMSNEDLEEIKDMDSVDSDLIKNNEYTQKQFEEHIKAMLKKQQEQDELDPVTEE